MFGFRQMDEDRLTARFEWLTNPKMFRERQAEGQFCGNLRREDHSREQGEEVERA